MIAVDKLLIGCRQGLGTGEGERALLPVGTAQRDRHIDAHRLQLLDLRQDRGAVGKGVAGNGARAAPAQRIGAGRQHERQRDGAEPGRRYDPDQILTGGQRHVDIGREGLRRRGGILILRRHRHGLGNRRAAGLVNGAHRERVGGGGVQTRYFVIGAGGRRDQFAVLIDIIGGNRADAVHLGRVPHQNGGGGRRGGRVEVIRRIGHHRRIVHVADEGPHRTAVGGILTLRPPLGLVDGIADAHTVAGSVDAGGNPRGGIVGGDIAVVRGVARTAVAVIGAATAPGIIVRRIAGGVTRIVVTTGIASGGSGIQRRLPRGQRTGIARRNVIHRQRSQRHALQRVGLVVRRDRNNHRAVDFGDGEVGG